MDCTNLQRLFWACDVNKSGVIEYDDFTVVCRELNVPEGEIKHLFNRLDADGNGLIDYSDFSSRFNEVSETLDLSSFGGGPYPRQATSSWGDFLSSIDGGVLLPESLQGQLADLYQAIQSSLDPSLLPQYENVLRCLVAESVEHTLQREQLESSLKRTEEMNSSQLAELEDDLQQQLAHGEESVREEERRRTERIMADMQRKHENEVADLHATVDRLLKSQEEFELNNSREEVFKLNCQIRELTQENEHLRSSLVKEQTNISILHSELDKLKNMYADHKAQHERESDNLKRMVIEYQSYAKQVEILQEMNKKLYDSNGGLRSALASDVASTKRKLSPQNETPARRMKPIDQSTMMDSSQRKPNKMDYSHVATWASKYLDSGVDQLMEISESSGSDYDSDNSMDSVETVHHSYSCVPSDIEVSEVKSEATITVRPTKTSSIASSIRRRLSAFSMRNTEGTIDESEEAFQMYRLVLAGDAGAGKSSFLLRLTTNEFRGDIQTTLGVDFQIKRMLVDGKKTSLQIWDTAGQERFRSIARSYFRKAHGVLLLYDVTSENSYLNVRAWVDEIQEANEHMPMCIIGNKVDLREGLPEGSYVDTAHGEKLAKAYGALFCETSAKEGTNVVEAVLHLAREVRKHVKWSRPSESEIKLSPPSAQKKSNSCCGFQT